MSLNSIKKILIVEDDLTISMITAKYLRRIGYTIETKMNGEAALEYLEATDSLPDLILSDIMMPKMDGINFLKNIKQNENLKNLPIVAVTAMEEELIPNEKDLKFDGIIKKPFSLKELSLEIEELLKLN